MELFFPRPCLGHADHPLLHGDARHLATSGTLLATGFGRFPFLYMHTHTCVHRCVYTYMYTLYVYTYIYIYEAVGL